MSWHRPLSGIAKHLKLGVLLLLVATALHCKGANIQGPEDMEEEAMSSEASEPSTASSDVGPSEQGAVGSVVGTVEVDGRPMPGVEVAATPDLFGPRGGTPARSTMTGPGGEFGFSDLESGVFAIEAGATMLDSLECTGGTVVEFAFEGQVKTVNIKCPGHSGTFAGTLRFSGGDRTHDPFVFSAGDGRDVKVTYRMGGSVDTLVIQGPAFAPSSLPRLSGPIDASGRFTIRGEGPIAGHKGVSVVATGRFIGAALFQEAVLEIDKIVVGGAGELPKGTPINYEFTAATQE